MIYVQVCFINPISNVMEGEILLREQMTTQTTGEEIFQLLEKFVAESGFDRFNCITVIMEGATAMAGQHSCLVQVKSVAPNAVSCYCFMHCEVLIAKEIGEALTHAVKTVKCIKASSLNSYVL
jgi:hypothetical protein